MRRLGCRPPLRPWACAVCRHVLACVLCVTALCGPAKWALAGALDTFTAARSDPHLAGVRLRWQEQGDAVFSGSQRHTLEGVLSELVSNVLEHAGAGLLTVDWTASADAIVLSVADDGCGLPATPANAGQGLNSVRSCAAQCGGTAAWERGEHGGGRGRVCLPLKPASTVRRAAALKLRIDEPCPEMQGQAMKRVAANVHQR